VFILFYDDEMSLIYNSSRQDIQIDEDLFLNNI